MATINDLNWGPHSIDKSAEYARVEFPNGYAASCIRGGSLFYTKGGTFEVAVMDKNGLNYSTPITKDVLGYLSESEANKALADIEALPAAK